LIQGADANHRALRDEIGIHPFHPLRFKHTGRRLQNRGNGLFGTGLLRNLSGL
jgi:hypothetical protein